MAHGILKDTMKKVAKRRAAMGAESQKTVNKRKRAVVAKPKPKTKTKRKPTKKLTLTTSKSKAASQKAAIRKRTAAKVKRNTKY